MPVHTRIAACAWNGGNTCHWGVCLKWRVYVPLGTSFFWGCTFCGVYMYTLYLLTYQVELYRWFRSLLLCPLSVECYYFPWFPWLFLRYRNFKINCSAVSWGARVFSIELTWLPVNICVASWRCGQTLLAVKHRSEWTKWVEISQLISQPVSESDKYLDQSINQSITQPTSQSVNQSEKHLDQSINQSISQPVNQWIGQINILINQSVIRFINQPVGHSFLIMSLLLNTCSAAQERVPYELMTVHFF